MNTGPEYHSVTNAKAACRTLFELKLHVWLESITDKEINKYNRSNFWATKNLFFLAIHLLIGVQLGLVSKIACIRCPHFNNQTRTYVHLRDQNIDLKFFKIIFQMFKSTKIVDYFIGQILQCCKKKKKRQEINVKSTVFVYCTNRTYFQPTW